MRALLALLVLVSTTAMAAEGETYIKDMPKAQLTKFQALKELLATDNQAKIYKCVLVEVSSKGTVKNK